MTALTQLSRVLRPFPFATCADRRRALAALVTIAIRPLIRGPVPLIVINANAPRTAKSLLAETLASVAMDRPCFSYANMKNEDQWLRALSLVASSEGTKIGIFDDVGKSLSKAAPLMAFATSPTWTYRKLGSPKITTVDNRATIILTGNNLPISADLERRSLLINMMYREKWPRNGALLTSEQLKKVVRQGFAAMFSEWITAGAPLNVTQSDSTFENWQETVWGIVNAAYEAYEKEC